MRDHPRIHLGFLQKFIQWRRDAQLLQCNNKLLGDIFTRHDSATAAVYAIEPPKSTATLETPNLHRGERHA